VPKPFLSRGIGTILAAWEDSLCRIDNRTAEPIFFEQMALPLQVFPNASFLRAEAEQKHPEFAALAERWRRETRFLSSLDEKILHPAYQSIIAMGKSAVPLVLSELESHHGHWFWALRFMSGEDSVPEGSNIAQARKAWLDC